MSDNVVPTEVDFREEGTEKTSRVPQPASTRAEWIVDRIMPYWWGGFLLVVLVLFLYAPTVGFDFVNWDDPWYVIENPLIRSWHPVNLFRVATQISVKNFAPVTIFSYLVDHTLWGLWPGGYHLTNLLLHAVNCVLVYLLIVQLSGRRLVGWATAALFAVHPVHVESVVWISSRKGLLSAAFILASLIFWLRRDRTARHEGWALLFFALALLSKAIAVVVPAVVLAYDVFVRREKLAAALPRQFIPGVMAACLLFLTMTAQPTEMGGIRDHLSWSKGRILAVDMLILWKYVGMLAWPRELCVLYDPPTTGVGGLIALSAAGWLVVAAAAYRCRHRSPTITLAAVTFLLFLLPVLNLFPITTLMNDRYLYLPSIPVFALFSTALARWPAAVVRWMFVGQPPRSLALPGRVAYCTVLFGVLVCLGSRTQHQLPVWRNGMSLWQHAVRHVPQLPVVQIQLANTLHEHGRSHEAVAVLRRALSGTEPDRLDRQRILRKLKEWQKRPASPM